MFPRVSNCHFNHEKPWIIDDCVSYFLQDWTSYEEFSDITESNVFLAQEQPEAQPSTVGVALHPDAVHEPRATGTDEGDVSWILLPFLSYYHFLHFILLKP